MPDVPARIGVPVWREHCVETTDSRGNVDHEHDDFHGDAHAQCFDPRGSNPFKMEPGLWFASTPEAVAEMRERLTKAIYVFEGETISSMRCGQIADAVLREMGFTDV